MKKAPLVLVPGLLCDHALWEHQASSLSKIADCIITDKHIQYESIGQIAEAVVAEAPPRFALAGLSMGGYIALEICRRFGERVERLFLVDTSARVDTPEQTGRREKLMTLCREDKFAEIIDILYTVLVHPDRLNDSVLKSQIVDMAKRMGTETFIRQQRAIMGRCDQVPNLSAIACPTMIVCGEQDQVTPLECSEEMAANIKGSELVVIPDCGHMSTMEKPQVLSQLMQTWLTDCEKPLR